MEKPTRKGTKASNGQANTKDRARHKEGWKRIKNSRKSRQETRQARCQRQKKRKEIMAKESKKAQGKIKKVMGEFKEGKLHSGSKKGPEVSNRKQAIAIAMSEARKRGMKVPAKKK
jgi:hypothetical protein